VPRLSLDELLSTSDAVSLHLPGRPGAAPLLGAAEIARMKPGALLVNLARASLVDVDAVVAALESRALAGAAFDVWTSEPPAVDDPRLQTRGLLVTPHVGWSSPQADEAWRDEAIDALRAALTAQPASPAQHGRAADYAV
jgi:glycerate dehydrogenase